MFKINKVAKILMFFFIILASIITAIDINCFNRNFYYNEYEKLNTAKDIGVSNEDLNLMTDDLLDYLKSNKENLDLQVSINGKVREVFNQREKIHMVDVKDLYDNVILIRNASIVFALCCLVIFIFNNDFKGLLIAYKKNLIFFGFIFLLIGLMCIIDFDTFWYDFHTIFFTKNDYWLLDPNTDILINMVPSQFFFDLCIRIVMFVLASLGIYYGLFYCIAKKVDR